MKQHSLKDITSVHCMEKPCFSILNKLTCLPSFHKCAINGSCFTALCRHCVTYLRILAVTDTNFLFPSLYLVCQQFRFLLCNNQLLCAFVTYQVRPCTLYTIVDLRIRVQCLMSYSVSFMISGYTCLSTKATSLILS